jgi:hypothetical protein
VGVRPLVGVELEAPPGDRDVVAVREAREGVGELPLADVAEGAGDVAPDLDGQRPGAHDGRRNRAEERRAGAVRLSWIACASTVSFTASISSNGSRRRRLTRWNSAS